MASAKELKKKIKTVSNTQKITSTMEMVAAAKAKQTQGRVHATLPYSEKLGELLESLSSGGSVDHYLLRAPEKVERNALLVECGQHYEAAAAEVAMETTLRFLAVAGTIDSSLLADYGYRQTPAPQKVIRVTEAVTIDSEDFRFTEAYRGLEVIPRAGTVIAEDGGRPVRTPYDNCVLIMPTRRVRPGNTAVRLGRFLA